MLHPEILNSILIVVERFINKYVRMYCFNIESNEFVFGFFLVLVSNKKGIWVMIDKRNILKMFIFASQKRKYLKNVKF